MLFELVSALAERAEGKIGLQVAWNAEPPSLSQAERAGRADLEALGVELLPEITVDAGSTRARLARMLWPSLEDLHPEAASHESLMRHVEPFRPDVVLPIWTEWLTAALSRLPFDKFAYYGNPDLKSVALRAEFMRQIGECSAAEFLRTNCMVARLEPVHLRAMRQYRWLGNVAANDARYYELHGHPYAFYIQNTWFDRFGSGWRKKRAALERASDSSILGNLGKLGGTANTMGLHYLGTQFMPELERIAGVGVTVRVCGAGAPHPAIARALRRPGIEMLGFVDDIDSEILASKVFLCVNNATAYKVGHTRYLHAWSLGACVVAHKDAALSMPEIVHRENALLGANAREIAELVKEALGNAPLRRRLGDAGYETFKKSFAPRVVAERILAVVR